MPNINAKWNRVRGVAVATLCVAMLVIGLTSTAMADEWNKKTIVTFSAPVEVPGGKVLPAGTYVFKLLDSASNRNIVQIFDKDERRLYATILAIPDYRLKPTDKTVINFEERPSNSPEAIKAWFYPGDEYGQQFVYPRKRAVEIAKRTNQNVLSMRNEMADHISAPAKTPSAPSVKAMQQTEVTGMNPSGEPVEREIVILTKPEK